MDIEQRDKIARRVATARELSGWSQERLASEAGVAINTVRSLEKGQPVRPGSLSAILSALGVEPLSEVAERTGWPADVHVIVEVVALTLMGMPEDERPAVAARIMRALMVTDS